MANANILSKRYATRQINEIFSDVNKVIAERKFWISVMKNQQRHGVDIPDEAIKKYRNAVEKIDLLRIRDIEKKTRHDVKARIEAFNEAADAGQYIHLGMTSRDLTDNVEQVLIKKASQIILGKFAAILKRLIDMAEKYKSTVITARTHHQPAQPTLLGKRFATWAEELALHLEDFEQFINNYPMRGIKGPAGTRADMINLLGSGKKVDMLEAELAKELGFTYLMISTGQVYPRSLDHSLISKIALLTSPVENMAKTIRLMAGLGLVTEGFKKGQTGSSAMPHKMNCRSSERICALAKLIKGYEIVSSMNSGDQWEEGDVSCSVVRRVIIPDTFYAADGFCETTLTVLDGFGVFEAAINNELNTYGPFLSTTALLAAAVEAGVGRENAHEIIKEVTINAARIMKSTGEIPEVAAQIALREEFAEKGFTKNEIVMIIERAKKSTGDSDGQIGRVKSKADEILNRHQKWTEYKPVEIL